MCHVQENTENIERQERYDRILDSSDNYLFEIMYYLLKRSTVNGCKSKSKGEGEDEGCHDSHNRRNAHAEERQDLFSIGHFLKC